MKVCVLLKQQWITVGPYLAVFYFHFDVYFVIMKVIFPQCMAYVASVRYIIRLTLLSAFKNRI